MNTKHTPGPWKYIALPDDSFEIQIESGAWILMCTSASNPTVEEREEDDANVRLAASAPDLLKQLQHVVRFFDQLNQSDIDRYRASISKATGSKS